MRLTEVRIKNFKSFSKQQSVPLSQLTLLIGPNNAGKSNLLEVFATIRSTLSSGGGLPEHLQSRLDPSEAMLAVLYEEQGNHGTYEVRFPKGRNSPSLTDEAVRPALTRLLDDYRIHRAVPANMDAAAPVQRIVRVGPEGQSAAAVLDHLRDRYPENYAALQRDLARCAPEIASVTAEATESGGAKEIYFNDRKSGPLRSVFASEGLKFLLFMLLILHSPSPPGLLAFEEIEHGVHPRRVKDIVGFLRQLTQRPGGPQVLVTTHSPLVVDQFRDTPEQVIVVERGPEGGTVCTRLVKRLKALGSVDAGTALGELWYSGVLGGVPAT